LDQLQLDHLEGDQRQLAEIVGIEKYKEMLRVYSGSTVYIPTVDTVTLALRDTLIRMEYTGYNALALAQKWGLSERWIRCICEEIHEKMKRAPIPGQVGFFD
jgi:Mor family transcriptional regulator